MNIAYFDCFSGISGDMVLGALVDAGCDLAQMETQLRRIPISGWKISAEKVHRKGLAATRVHVECAEQHHHRSLSIILKLIQDAGLSEAVTNRASRIFQRLGEAEAHVHGAPIEKIHFHEVGAVDAIVDIVGAAIGFEMLGIDEFACSPSKCRRRARRNAAWDVACTGACDGAPFARRADVFQRNYA